MTRILRHGLRFYFLQGGEKEAKYCGLLVGRL